MLRMFGRRTADDEPSIIASLFDELMNTEEHPFPVRGKIGQPDRKGVYVIYSPDGDPLHVGRTPAARRGLAQRLSNHLQGASSFYVKYLAPNNLNLRDGYKYRYLIVENDRHRALLEFYTLGHLCPKHIGLSRGRDAQEALDQEGEALVPE